MDDNLKDAAAAAWKEVLAHPAADLKNFLTAEGVVFSGSKKPAADFCPVCKSKKKFGLIPDTGSGWGFKCFSPECVLNEGGKGTPRYIELTHGCDWREARRILHRVTGIPGFDELKDEAKRDDAKKPTPANSKTDEPPDTTADQDGDEPLSTGDAPRFIRIPETDRNVYEEAWQLLSLMASHRKEIRAKRGIPDEWIDALGFKSSIPGNRHVLEPLLDMFPPNELLRSGIAARQKNDWKKLKIADQLCGGYWEFDEETRQPHWIDKELVIIPYIDPAGRIVGLRPHKRGLTNGNFREDQASEFYEKNHSNLSIIYGESFLIDRPEKHEHRLVICEGEFKAAALAYCGIPAIGFQGIQWLRNNHQTGQAVTYLVELLRRHKIREVIVVFDNEDKSHKQVKKPKDRFIAEIYSRYTALKLENHGFKALFGMLPDDWMEGGETQPDGKLAGGKADWDGRLAWHLRRAKGDFSRARNTATIEFERFLSNRQGKKPSVMPVPRQMDWMASFKEDVIGQELNRLNYEPDCFAGGKHEIEVAAEITGYCHPEYRDLLNVENVAKALRKTYGGYYLVKPPAEKTELRVITIKKDLLWMLDQGTTKPEANGNTRDLSEDEIRSLRAALLCCNTILYKMPKPFTDFTVLSQYKVLVTEPDGSTRRDRLCVFIDANGRRSEPVQVNWDKMSSSQECRKIFLKAGDLHYSGGQTEIDAMVRHIDVDNYQKTITEIDTYGFDRKSGLILLGDCALAEGEKEPFIFPDNNGIIWYKSMGYKNSESLSTFCHKPPILFPGEGKPKDIYKAIDWDQERKEVAEIWREALRLAYASFGDYNGYVMVAGILQYLAHPETIDQIPGKPGLWVQGAKGSGKTQTIMAYMRMLGYVQNYGVVGLTGTKVGIERSLSQFDCLPVHIDEWRNVRASDDLVGFVTNAFNGLSIAKGTAQGTKSIRLSRAATIPIVTGEDMTTDTALLSRYIRLTMSASARAGTQEEQRQNFFKMQELSGEFYRIGRLLMRERKKFSENVVTLAKEFNSNKVTMETIRDPRARECTSVGIAAIRAANFMITGSEMPEEKTVVNWFLNHGKSNAEEIEKDIFRLRWFTDCVNLVTGGHDADIKKFIQVRRGGIMADGSVNILRGNIPNIMLSNNGRLYILIAPNELFAAYQRDQSRRREAVPIDIRNIRHELSREPYWIPAPRVKPGVHRFTVDGFRPQSWWVMDYERAGDLKDIVSTIYERFLAEHDLRLNSDGKVVHSEEVETQLQFDSEGRSTGRYSEPEEDKIYI